MDTPLDRRTAFKVAAGACLAGPLAGQVVAQPRPNPTTPPLPGAQPANPPGGPVPAPPREAALPNAASYPTEILGRKLEDWIKDIDSPDPSVREGAIRVVVHF